DILVEYSESEEEWKITPENAYRLAIENKLKVPDALANLMEFILKTVKSQNQAGTERNIYDQVNPYINPAISSDI
ncbi:MAG: hypothetical protein GTN53_27905, partial [Candidatus Aminicenantes bacterium]|nr:hypothetical protein [Candidatus Aminicenantes bacterium]NIT26339.1 hypothetical protein [Candidatus Aminicenantes bacterium]